MTTEFKQQRSLFKRNIVAFGLIFILLGLIVNQILVSSLYKNIDDELIRMSDNQLLPLAKKNSKSDSLNDPEIKPFPSENQRPPNSFQSEILLWSASGKIVNQDTLGNRFNDFVNLTLDASNLGKISSLTVENEYGQKMSFRAITLLSPDPSSRYIQYLTSTTQTEDTLHFFRQVLIFCMIVFWLLSIAVSFYLAKLNMVPIMLAWQRQQEFVENSSHELRTPLTIIQAKLEKLFLQPEQTIIDASEDIALALNEVKRLDQLTKDLLLLARSDSNQLVLAPEPVATQAFLEEIIQPYQEIAASQGKTFQSDIAETPLLELDKRLMTQLLIIVIDNALKYTQAGDEILLSTSLRQNDWVITLADTGLGFQSKDKSQIFERFYREDKARQRKSGGNGLGLSIAKWIVTSHHGEISAHDNQPRGALFIITIPLK